MIADLVRPELAALAPYIARRHRARTGRFALSQQAARARQAGLGG